MSVRHSLLTILDLAPCYGYQLKQEFELRTGGSWPVNVGQIYSTLERLERDGLVNRIAESDSAQVLFEITASGHTEAVRWLEDPIVEDASTARNELATKLALAMTLPSIDVGQIIQNQRRATIEQLQSLNRVKRESMDSRDHQELSWQLIVDSLIFANEAQVRWLDHTEARLARLRDASVEVSFPLTDGLPRRGRPRKSPIPSARSAATEADS
jgi:DNA-binding PadR family transcriptional regulator